VNSLLKANLRKTGERGKKKKRPDSAIIPAGAKKRRESREKKKKKGGGGEGETADPSITSIPRLHMFPAERGGKGGGGNIGEEKRGGPFVFAPNIRFFRSKKKKKKKKKR